MAVQRYLLKFSPQFSQSPGDFECRHFNMSYTNHHFKYRVSTVKMASAFGNPPDFSILNMIFDDEEGPMVFLVTKKAIWTGSSNFQSEESLNLRYEVWRH